MNINPKALELIARDMGNEKSGWQLVKHLKEVGVPEEIIVYPNTKWRMVYDIFVSLLSHKDHNFDVIFTKILTEFVHPLNLNGNIYLSNILIERYNNWLEFDGWKIEKYGGGYIFTVSDTVIPDEVAEEMMKSHQKEVELSKNNAKKPTIEFIETDSVIIVNDIRIPIPYASNQFELCKNIFKKTSKRWEYDELLEKFGVDEFDQKSNRKVYDAMLAINKKVMKNTGIEELIKYDRRTFQFNPDLASNM